MEVVAVCWMVLAGIGIAVGSLWYTRRFVGGFVRKLIELDASSEETAVSVEEVHCKMTIPLRNALKEDGSLSGILGIVSGKTPRYYILPNRLIMAKRKYRTENTGVAFLLLVILLLVLFGVAFTIVYPLIADMIADVFS